MKRLLLALGLLVAVTASAVAAPGSVYSYSAASSFGLANQIIYCPTATGVSSGTDLKCTPAQIAAYNYSLMSGDCTASGTGAVTCLKTNGVAFGTLATLSALPLSDLATQAANTVVGNGTGGSAAPIALAMPSCSSGTNALIWTSGTGFGCNTISGGGSVTVTTSCPPTSQSGSTIALITGTVPASEAGAYAASAADCQKVFTITGGPFTLPAVAGLPSTYGVTVINGNLAGGASEIVQTTDSSNILVAGASATSVSQPPGESIYYSLNAAATGWVGTGTTPTWHPGYISGLFYDFNDSRYTATGLAQVASSVYCTLEDIYVPVTVKALGSYFTTGVASGNVSYALFTAAGGRPATLIDYAGPVAAPTTTNTAASALLHNTTDTLAPGVYFACETQDNATAVMNSPYNGAGAWGAAWVGASAPTSGTFTAVVGISCTAASTCGTGFAAWSGGAFTWASFTNPTWATNESTKIPLIEMQAN